MIDLKLCSQCGMCKSLCPVLKAVVNEKASPRTKAILVKKDIPDEELFYLCTLCQGCQVSCPAGIALHEQVQKMRERLVREGKETEANKKMMENLRRYGNPFGKDDDEKLDIKELYCC